MNKTNKIDTGPISLNEWNIIKPNLTGLWPVFYELLWQTGIRVSEGLMLKPSDLIPDFKDNYIKVTRLKKRKEIIDELPINGHLMNDLLSLCSNRNYLFSRTIRKKEKVYTRVTAFNNLKKALKRAKFERNLHPHNFRHGFGKRIAEIQELTALDSLQLIKKALNLSSINYATRYSKMSDTQAINILKKLNS